MKKQSIYAPNAAKIVPKEEKTAKISAEQLTFAPLNQKTCCTPLPLTQKIIIVTEKFKKTEENYFWLC